MDSTADVAAGIRLGEHKDNASAIKPQIPPAASLETKL